MSSEYSYLDAVKSARDAQQKFDYFFLGIILATLSLSVQSFPICNIYSMQWLLIVSWLLWLISLFAGLFRLARMVGFLATEARYMGYHPKREALKQAKDGLANVWKELNVPWTQEEIREELKSLDRIKGVADENIEKYSKHALIASHIMHWSFYIGLVSFVAFKIMNLK